jgi:hypothetical protein
VALLYDAPSQEIEKNGILRHEVGKKIHQEKSIQKEIKKSLTFMGVRDRMRVCLWASYHNFHAKIFETGRKALKTGKL